MKLSIIPPDSILETEVSSLPRSKSVAARAMVRDAVAGRFPAPEAEDNECDDLRALRSALQPGVSGEVNLGMSATALRFLTAYFAAKDGSDVTLAGDARLLERPVGPLVDALRSMGAEIEYVGAEGFAPLHIKGHKLKGGRVALDCTLTSQGASALLLAAPLMEEPVEVVPLDGVMASRPYFKLTELMMQPGGGGVDVDEPDWSAASFWYELTALSGGFITLRGLDLNSAQPDAACARIFASLGVNTEMAEEAPDGVDLCGSPDQMPRLRLDLRDNPDMVVPVVVTAAMLRIPFRIEGTAALRVKECDRMAALAEELGRCGIVLEAEPDAIQWEGQLMPISEIPAFNAHGDHRMAMALSGIAMYVPGITIDGAECVAKSYPGWWEALRAAGFTVKEAADSAE